MKHRDRPLENDAQTDEESAETMTPVDEKSLPHPMATATSAAKASGRPVTAYSLLAPWAGHANAERQIRGGIGALELRLHRTDRG